METVWCISFDYEHVPGRVTTEKLSKSHLLKNSLWVVAHPQAWAPSVSLIWITCISHACLLNYINRLWSEGKYTYKSTNLMYIKYPIQQRGHQECCESSTWDWACTGMMSTDIDTLTDILLWYVHLCLWAFGQSTWCPPIPQIEPALDSSFLNWEYVPFEVQLQCMLRRWILWILSFNTPPQFSFQYVDEEAGLNG